MYGSGRFICKEVDSLSRVFGSRPTARNCNVDSQNAISVKIPKRIERGPTDILKALSSTVKKDFTAFGYKYPDDPYFYSYSIPIKKINALALESGRNSAEWVIKNNPKFFSHKLSEPVIEEFVSKIADNAEVNDTEDKLLNVIKERSVLEAIKIYQTLKTKGENIQDSTKQSLLELVCYYNSEEKPALNVEQKWFENINSFTRKIDKKDTERIWKENGFAEQLFAEMNPNCPLACASIILGRIKYNEVDKGMKLYEEAKVKNMKLPVKVYNAILSASYSIVPSNKDIFEFVKYILRDMEQNEVPPDLDTFNSWLMAMSRTSHAGTVKKFWQEFLSLGIKPSLGSYGYLFKSFSRVKVAEKETLPLKNNAEKILKNIMKQNFEIEHPSDFDFFTNTMEAFSRGFNNINMILELQKMICMPKFEKFVPNAVAERCFYNQFIVSVFKNKPIDFAMNVYKRLIFTAFSPDPYIYKVILTAIGENHATEALVQVWNDLELLNFKFHFILLEKVVELNKYFDDEASLKVLYEAAVVFFDVIKSKTLQSEVDRFSPAILQIFLKSNDEARALGVLKLINENDLLFTTIMDNDIALAFSYGISKNNAEFIRETLKFADREEYQLIDEIVEKALPFLEETDKAWANTLKSRKT